jgi:hypothetical protein
MPPELKKCPPSFLALYKSGFDDNDFCLFGQLATDTLFKQSASIPDVNKNLRSQGLQWTRLSHMLIAAWTPISTSCLRQE